jgi:hypothetical protein
MKRSLLAVVCCFALIGSTCAALGQERPKGYSTVIPATRMAPPDSAAEQFSAVTSPTPLPTFSYTIQASTDRGGLAYSGSIVGRSPLSRGKTTTTIPTQIIPLVITIADTAGGTGTVTYDPTAADSCVSGSPTDVSVITNSPIFTNNAWTMNGVSIGTTQYIDAFQRAQFWSLVQGTPYHLILKQSTLGSQALTFTAGTNYNSGSLGFPICGNIGVVNMTDMDDAIHALITGPLAGMVNVGTFPIFLTHNVVMANPGHDIFMNCCILGYHSGLFVGGNLQIYSPFSLDTSGVFDNDVSTLSHEMGEAINDPPGNNPTPLWGGIGQQPNCQDNFEVGDPLSPGFGTPTNEFVVGGYHLQELAFYSWFYGSTSLGVGAGGGFSNNGTFTGDAKACPPGGTN